MTPLWLTQLILLAKRGFLFADEWLGIILVHWMWLYVVKWPAWILLVADIAGLVLFVYVVGYVLMQFPAEKRADARERQR